MQRKWVLGQIIPSGDRERFSGLTGSAETVSTSARKQQVHHDNIHFLSMSGGSQSRTSVSFCTLIQTASLYFCYLLLSNTFNSDKYKKGILKCSSSMVYCCHRHPLGGILLNCETPELLRGSGNDTEASIDAVVRSKLVKFQFSVN